jgi:hypothetical protein
VYLKKIRLKQVQKSVYKVVIVKKKHQMILKGIITLMVKYNITIMKMKMKIKKQKKIKKVRRKKR